MCNCSTPTIPNDESETSIKNRGSSAQISSELITKDILQYYVLDTVNSNLYIHYNGRCFFDGETLAWESEDSYNLYYDYEVSKDTLFFYSHNEKESLHDTYVRQTDEHKTKGSSLSGVWIKQQKEGAIFNPESLVVSGVVAIKKSSMKKDPPYTDSQAFWEIVQDVAASQDGVTHPHGKDEDEWGPDWYLMFYHRDTKHLSEEELHELCDPCEDIVRTKSSMSFTRKGTKFKISAEDMIFNEHRKRYNFKISVDGKSCVFTPELIDATEDVCLDESYLPSFFHDRTIEEGKRYVALGSLDIDGFLECYHKLF